MKINYWGNMVSGPAYDAMVADLPDLRPHGGRPPSDEAVRATTARYVEQERRGELRDLKEIAPTRF